MYVGFHVKISALDTSLTGLWGGIIRRRKSRLPIYTYRGQVGVGEGLRLARKTLIKELEVWISHTEGEVTFDLDEIE